MAALVAAAALMLPAGAAEARPVRAVTADNPTGFAFKPATKRTVKGRYVHWTNKTDQAHTVVFYKGPAKIKRFTLNPEGDSGASKRRRFRKRGTYKYYCSQQGHSIRDGEKCVDGMCGTVKVRPAE